MGKLVLISGVSVDGYFEGPNREIDWHVVDEELHEHFNEVLAGMGVFLSGRLQYELMASYWPTADTNPTSTPAMVEFGRIWVQKPKVVYSRTLSEAGWNTTIVREVVPEEVLALKEQAAGDLVLGGADLAAEFLRLGLVDELRLYVHPVLIGRGRPGFLPTDRKFDLQLLETRTFGNGVALLQYSVV